MAIAIFGFIALVAWRFFLFSGVVTRQTSRIVTIIDGVQVIEVTVHDQGGDPIETHYLVQGQKYGSLKEAMKAARGDGEGGLKG